MPKFHVTAADPMEAWVEAVADARTAAVADGEEPMDAGLVPPITMDA